MIRFGRMNLHLKETFSRMKPVCDTVMVCPSQENIAGFVSIVSELREEDVQELQQYLMFPFITHLRSSRTKNKHDQLRAVVDAIRLMLEKVTVNSFEMCMKIETGLLCLIFDKTKPGMIADVPEELKLSIMQCLTALMLHIDYNIRVKLLKTQIPLLAQTIFVSVHTAKLEKLRALRLAAIENVMAQTGTHEQLTNKEYQMKSSEIEFLSMDMLASILPGVLAALQDVAMCKENPGHAVVVLHAGSRSLNWAEHPLKMNIAKDAHPSLTEDNVKKVEDVLADGRVTIRHVAEVAGISYGSVQRILANELHMKKVSAR